MGVAAALAALFQALGQASGPATPGADPRQNALDDALRGCVEQAAAAALGRPPGEAEQAVLRDAVLPQARSYVESFRVLDESEGGGVRFLLVEADVALGRLMRRLAPAARVVETRLVHEAGPGIPVRGTGQMAVSARAHGPVLVDGKAVGEVDESAWGFGPTPEAAAEDAVAGAEDRCRTRAQRFAEKNASGATAALWVSVRGLVRARGALALRDDLAEHLALVRAARLVRAGGGAADLLVETAATPADLAAAIESLRPAGLTLTAAATPGGDIAVEVLPP
jgi:hypothetical protein